MVRKQYRHKERAGVLLILELLLSLAVVLFLYQKVAEHYFKKPLLDKPTEKALNEQGIDTANYRSVIDSTKNKFEDIQQQHADALEGMR
jgi:hypothetical protein